MNSYPEEKSTTPHEAAKEFIGHIDESLDEATPEEALVFLTALHHAIYERIITARERMVKAEIGAPFTEKIRPPRDD